MVSLTHYMGKRKERGGLLLLQVCLTEVSMLAAKAKRSHSPLCNLWQEPISGLQSVLDLML